MRSLLQAIVLLLILIWLQTCMITAQDLEWKSATATYTNQTNGSIIIGTFLTFLQLLLYHSLQMLLVLIQGESVCFDF